MRYADTSYRHFTDEEIDNANHTDILFLAEKYGYEPEKAGRKVVHMKHSGGLYLFPESNRFFQWTGPDGGIKGGAIDFVMREEKVSFGEAVGKLLGKEYATCTCERKPYQKCPRKPLVLPDKAKKFQVCPLVSYVCSRHRSGDRSVLYGSKDDLSGGETQQLRFCGIRFGRNGEILRHAGSK